MKTPEEIEKLADEKYLEKVEDINNSTIRGFIVSAVKGGFVDGYQQCQENLSNSWTNGCECKDSIGQTWCCNQCGLPYDTRKSDKKYTEEDLRKAFYYGGKSAIDEYGSFETYINSLKKQD